MNYEKLYFRRIININTHEFIRDIDLREVALGNDVIEENELPIYAPACVGSNRIATFDEHGEFVAWASQKGEHQPKGAE